MLKTFEIVFAPEHVFVPPHAFLERAHGVIGAIEIAIAHPDRELDHSPAHGCEAVTIGDQIARHQREEIARLGPGIVPFGPMAAIGIFAACCQIAVGQQYGKCRFCTGHPHIVDTEHVGAVGEEGDPAETLRLALGAKHSVRGVQPFELRIGRGIDLGHQSKFVRFAGERNDQIFALHPPTVDCFAIDQHFERGKTVAFEPDPVVSRALRISRQLEHGANARLVEAQREIERDFGHQPIRWAIILTADYGRGFRRGRHFMSGIGHFGIANDIHRICLRCFRR